jgi:hypothetical protein
MEQITLTSIVLFAAAVQLILVAVMLETPNFRSTLIFKLLPIITGVLCLISGLKMIGQI